MEPKLAQLIAAIMTGIEKLIRGNIFYGEEFELAYDGMKVKSSYTPLGMMAAISGGRD
jgi:hypothetical protein